MNRLLIATVCILTGLALIIASLPRRKYVTLSGHRDGRLWVKRVLA